MATASRDALDEDRMEGEEEDEGEGEQDGGSQDGTTEEAVPQSAPRYPVPARRLAAVEVPAVVQNVDRAIRAFGRTPVLSHALDPERQSLPLYLNPESLFCKPLISHNTQTHNVVLKVTVPKRTGRKRKRGSDGPWQGDVEIGNAAPSNGNGAGPAPEQVRSQSRLDDPKLLRAKLAENVGKYDVEPVGVIRNTHRFRGLADFYWDTSNRSKFAQRYAEQALSAEVEKIKQFQLTPGVDKGPHIDVIPPPVLTHLSLPFIYNYAQNPYVRLTEDGKTFNATAVKQVGYFIAADDPAPTGPQEEPDLTDPRCVEVLGDLEEAFGLRPVWTRRSLMNFLGMRLRSWNELKRYLNYKAYQFKGGPWRDVVIPYGIDPRTDPKYRIYQTLMFKLQKNAQPGNALQRYSLFGDQDGVLPPTESHVFDGETYYLDGKVWQVCDITDPLLKQMFDDAAIREERHGISGWYHGGLWAKAKAIMKTKLVAIRFGRKLTPMDFASIMQAGDRTPTKSSTGVEPIRLPNLGLTRDELTEMYGKHPTKKKENRGYSVKVREPLRSQELEEEPAQGSGSRDDTNQWPAEEDDEDDNDDDEEVEDDEHDEDDEDDEEDADENEGETDIGDLSGQHIVAERHAQYPDLPRPVG